MRQFQLAYSLKVLLWLFLFFGGLYFARLFIIPMVFAVLLALLFMPFCVRLEKYMHSGLAAFICVLLFISFCIGISAILFWQVGNVFEDMQGIQTQVQQLISEAKTWIEEKFGLSQQKQDKIIENSSSNGSEGSEVISAITGILFGFLVDFILVVVYTFIFLSTRTKFYNFILQQRLPSEHAETKIIINNIQKVSQQYISGLAIMIGCLWIMYGIGFTIIGVEHALLFAVLCGILELVPFVGNFTGNVITMLMGITQGGGISLVIKIACTYVTVQFLQTYFLEPLVVGRKVKINAFATIAGLVLAELLWGVAGLILAIPLLGITKIVCSHIPGLQPYADLIGSDEKKKIKKKRLIKI
ncbi:MAG: AI-2E family transporter [Fimbriimonadaceae bacterium]|nr:AI-2E family transporter [Chitinophagales bacterium]